MESTEQNVLNCGWSKFDEQWGEWLCLKKTHSIYDTTLCETCPEYKKRKEKKNKTE